MNCSNNALTALMNYGRFRTTLREAIGWTIGNTALHEAFPEAPHIEVALSGAGWIRLPHLSLETWPNGAAFACLPCMSIKSICAPGDWRILPMAVRLAEHPLAHRQGGGQLGRRRQPGGRSRQARYPCFAQSRADTLALARHASNQAKPSCCNCCAAPARGLSRHAGDARADRAHPAMAAAAERHPRPTGSAGHGRLDLDRRRQQRRPALRLDNFTATTSLPRLASAAHVTASNYCAACAAPPTPPALLDEQLASDMELMVGADGSLTWTCSPMCCVPRSAMLLSLEERGGVLTPDGGRSAGAAFGRRPTPTR